MNKEYWRKFCGVLIAGLTALTVFAVELPTPELGKLETSSEGLADGIELTLGKYENLYGGPQSVAVLTIDFSRPQWELNITVDAENQLRTVEDFAVANGAVAAINFGYFAWDKEGGGGKPVGACRIDGKWLERGAGDRDVYGYFAFTDAEMAILPRNGEKAPEDFDSVRLSFPMLIVDGEIPANLHEEYSHVLPRHPRTAVGLDEAGELYWVVFDGRSPGNAIGVSCPDLADYMKKLGCVWALNFDGGGSTTMWTKNHGVVNHPSDNKKFDHEGARKVYDILYVRERTE